MILSDILTKPLLGPPATVFLKLRRPLLMAHGFSIIVTFLDYVPPLSPPVSIGKNTIKIHHIVGGMLG